MDEMVCPTRRCLDSPEPQPYFTVCLFMDMLPVCRHPAPRRFLGIPQSQSETTQPILRATQNMRAAVIEWWRRPPEK
eukprot:m.213209 g.213209  ORF g.213209 m.213209 type:complete len:77 (-) comp15082_c3_seq2:154-384(-)